MKTHTERMRADWDQRAADDSVYWVYMAHGRHYTDMKRVFELGGRQAVELAAPVLERLGVEPEGGAILDIGSGFGRLFPGFARMGFADILGVDVSAEMVRLGRELCPVRGARFVQGDGMRFDGVASESVDVCFSYNVFGHLPHARVVWSNVAETYRVLKPGGAFQLHFRGRHTVRERLLLAIPRTLRPPARRAFRLATMRGLDGHSRGNGRLPGSEETLNLAVALPERRVVERLRRMGFSDVETLPDESYADGTRFWAIGRKL